MLNTINCPTGTISSRACRTGLQCEHHEAEKYATYVMLSYLLLLWTLPCSSDNEKEGTFIRLRAHRDELISLENELGAKLKLKSDGSLFKTPI